MVDDYMAKKKKKKQKQKKQKTYRILIVEDDLTLLETLEYNLVESGYKVQTVMDGLGAIEVARAEKPDLIVLDVMLPGLDGFAKSVGEGLAYPRGQGNT